MTKFLFVLKCLLANLAIALIVGLLAGGLAGQFSDEHPHQIFPTWLVTTVLVGLAGLVGSLLISVGFVLAKQVGEFKRVIAINAALVLGWAGFLLVFLIRQ